MEERTPAPEPGSVRVSAVRAGHVVSFRERFGRRGRRAGGAVADALGSGAAVDVTCRLRRTSPRGWGPWTDATVRLGAEPGAARWATDDPVAVGLPSTNGSVDLPFEKVTDVYVRNVRFPSEAFWGAEGEIVVVTAERETIEVAVPTGQAELLAARLVGLADRGET